MKLSAPIYVLKSQAKALKKSQGISLSDALNEVARNEGYATWSLLMAKREGLFPESYPQILDFLNEGDLVLVAARPRAGKTIFTLGLVAQAMAVARPKGHLFTLVEREQVMRDRLNAHGGSMVTTADPCWIDCSDEINADYIIAIAKDRAQPGSLIVVDYLQILDEKRVNPPLQEQVVRLKEFARTTGCIIIFLCQLHRQIGDRADQRPTIDDIRLPNPLDLGLINKVIFLFRETPEEQDVEVSFAGRTSHRFKIRLEPERLRFVEPG